jgi:hypothetical protein
MMVEMMVLLKETETTLATVAVEVEVPLVR